jgi:hypothetical protein
MKLKLTCFAFAIAVSLTACGKKPSQENAGDAAKSSSSSSGNPVTAPVDYLGSVGGAKKRMEGSIGVSSMTQAIQQFQIAEGRFPKDLNELVGKGYLAQIPKAPYNMRYQYNHSSGEVTVVPAQ